MLNKKTRQLGFSLLEAIVSLVILSGVLAATYSWIDNVVTSSVRINENMNANEVVLNFLADLNPAWLESKREGYVSYGDYSVRWNAKIIDESVGFIANGKRSAFTLVLYQLDFDLAKSEELIRSSSVRKTGFVRSRLIEGG